MENKGHPLKSSFSFGSHFIVDYRLLIGARGEVSRSPGWWCLYYVRPGAWDRRSPSARLCCRQAALVRTALPSWTGFDCPATGWRLGRLVYTNEEASSQRCTADIWFGCPVDDVVRLEGEKQQDVRKDFARPAWHGYGGATWSWGLDQCRFFSTKRRAKLLVANPWCHVIYFQQHPGHV